MNVLTVCRAFPTPTDASQGIYVMKRAVGLASAVTVYGLQPVFYFPILKPAPKSTRNNTPPSDGLRVFQWPTFYLPRILKALDSYWMSRAIERAIVTLQKSGEINDIDVIDAHFGYPEGVGCWRAARKLGKSVFVTLRGLEADYPVGSRIYRQLAAALRDVDGCICVSHELKSLAINAGADPGRVIVIHNAVDRTRFHPGTPGKARENSGLSSDSPIIVSVGHLLDVKRHHVLIGAFSHVLKEIPEARLVIIGQKMHEPDYPAKLEGKIEELGLGDFVTLTGGLAPDLVADWLRSSDVFALASRREGCCNAILEALATGLPVVATPAGDNKHFIRDGENGFLTPFDDEREMGEILVKAIRKTSWDKSLISKSVPAKDWAAVGLDVKQFFERVLGRLVSTSSKGEES